MNDYLEHHGIKGMHWGIRRYQNSDGSLTAAGKKRYSRGELKTIRKEMYDHQKKFLESDKNYKKARKMTDEAWELANRYDFDADDGGGGTTMYDQAAGRKYMRMWDDISVLEDMANEASKKKAEKYISDKYGQVAIDQLKIQNTEAMFVMLAAVWSIPLVVAGVSLAADKIAYK